MIDSGITTGTWQGEPLALWRIKTASGIAWARGPVDAGPETLLDVKLDALLAVSMLSEH